MWSNSDDSDLHVYYNDGNSAQWVSVTSLQSATTH